MVNQEVTVRVGSRKSELAVIQTKHVIDNLQRLHQNVEFEIHTMTTMGDRVLNISLPKIGEKSLFTRDLEDVLKQGGIDMIVHSLKDLPTALPPNMVIGAILERENPNDVLILNKKWKNHSIATLPMGSIIGTSSLRRTAQLKRYYRNLSVCDIRGNLNTRLAKLDAPDSKFTGIILANAGVGRMGWQDRIDHVFDGNTELMYAVGQGALAVECREDDVKTLEMLKGLRSIPTTCCVLAERSFLKTLGGGCSAPVAVTSSLIGNVLDIEKAKLKLCGAVWSLDGCQEIRDELVCSLNISLSSSKSTDDIVSNLTTTTANTADCASSITGEVTSNDIEDNDKSKDCNKPENENEDSSECSSEPPSKRVRSNEEFSTDKKSVKTEPTIISDEEQMSNLVRTYDINDLIAKHIVYMGGQSTRNQEGRVIVDGAGDADNVLPSCPMKISVGQEVMGQCPFKFNENELQANLSSNGNDTNAVGKKVLKSSETPTTKSNNSAVEDNNNAGCVASVSGCPYQSRNNDQDTRDCVVAASEKKCPFLRKAVKVLAYNNENNTEPCITSMRNDQSTTNNNTLNDAVCVIEEKSYCGIYKLHSERESLLYEKCAKLGQELAERLIEKGALVIMHKAQSEIHKT